MGVAGTQGSISYRDANPGLYRLAPSEREYLACKDIKLALSGQIRFINKFQNKNSTVRNINQSKNLKKVGTSMSIIKRNIFGKFKIST